ncbi:hypothetical protein OKA04_09080 [Luteolibacter flavescens]|uniref:Verru_Chthon cassette protein A n=1 Tax=Luteolibacter flavescens TaxID=1859460 RepID=A0ABT3FMT0_9BACT|nr:hypothetical protein [Luteolibacter flavescens]MCW1884880.1 hypothetical protein [Luteolibacter flavescens]
MTVLTLSVLLVMLALGLLTLGGISLRSEGAGQAAREARANARLALMMALARLQEEVGDDRRITADASILGNTGQPHLVGVWESWSPGFTEAPDREAPDYDAEKSSRFKRWLVSGADEITRSEDLGRLEPGGNDVALFGRETDGFDLKGAPVGVPEGRYAWAVSQENTKAKVNVAGPEDDPDDEVKNAPLHVQPRPSLALSEVLRQPESGWDRRAGSVISLNQVELDSGLMDAGQSFGQARASFTASSFGVLSDVVRGGLKTDLSLGLELEDATFAQASWGGVANPFRSAGAPEGVRTPATYKGQRALFTPLVESPIVSFTTDYEPTNVANRFYAAGVPTFDHLRSFARLPYHLYGGQSPTVAERGEDHAGIALAAAPQAKTFFSPAKPPTGKGSALSIRPVLNRVIFLFSARLGADNQVRLVMTPVVVLWNPYNIALEMEGTVVYPWMDVPFRIQWDFSGPTVGEKRETVFMSSMMTKQHGRSIDPYFFCELTAKGDGRTNVPIRMEAGEVRIFSPASTTTSEFKRISANAARTVRMKPVDDIQQLNTKGGLSIPMEGGNGGDGFTAVMGPDDSVTVTVMESGATGRFNYFIGMEDATRIKIPSDFATGQVIAEVQTIKFSSPVPRVTSRKLTYGDLKAERQPFGVLETFQHVANRGLPGVATVSDLLYTTNPRQSAISHQLAAGSFTAVPHYQSHLRPVSTFDSAIQTSFNGQRSYWGGALDPQFGRDRLPFFEIPRDPVLSLGAFQHANLGSSTFSTSYQFGNSWASSYLPISSVGKLDKSKVAGGVPVYDTSYLVNEALWDGFFFSGISPVLEPGAAGTPGKAWETPRANVVKSSRSVLEDFVANSREHPLANPRMHLHQGGLTDESLVDSLSSPAGCRMAAAHLMVDGAFNINSTDVEAWTALLAGLRGQDFEVEGGAQAAADSTSFPRFRQPSGSEGDIWNGFRSLTDAQVRELAAGMVEQVKARGPFLSLAEFVNRRVEKSDLGKSGAVQSAIDAAGVNTQASQKPFPMDGYPAEAQSHIIPDSGVAIPGFLTQADVLQSLAPVITCRSDTFTIRAYGESLDKSGKVAARAWCEAVVQRTPDFIDAVDRPETAPDEASPVNRQFGRRFEIVSFQMLHPSEIRS